jgi:uncharacterized membrane protein YqjE
VLRIARTAGGALLVQAGLHAELLRVEWAESKGRVQSMVLAGLVGFACLLALLLALGALALSVSWDTPYRVPAALAVVVLYGLGVVLAWRRLRAQARLGEQSFAASRTELAADMELLSSQL